MTTLQYNELNICERMIKKVEYKTKKEIFSQFDALEKTYQYFNENTAKIKRFFDENSFSSITFLGSGSSYSICESAALVAKMELDIESKAVVAGDLMLNLRHYKNILKDTLLIAPSRSGSTSEVIRAVKNAKGKYNIPCVSISAKEDSELSKIAELNIELPWSFDESVCQTRTVTNLYVANLLFLDLIADKSFLKSDIKKAIDYGSTYLKENEKVFKSIVSEYEWNNIFVLADSELEGIASEGSLAFKEISRLNSYYHHLLDVRHGPMVLVNKNTLVIMATSPYGLDYQTELVADLKKNKATVITSGLKKEKISGSDLHIDYPDIKYPVRGIFFIIITQAVSYYKAIANNINPDEPEGLDPWINLS
jgi:fructoselysine-6-P-deglycase FrlB-like protein